MPREKHPYLLLGLVLLMTAMYAVVALALERWQMVVPAAIMLLALPILFGSWTAGE
jgi:hypothetical protein